ncbi:MurR/RpiR family transcriptional regulator [Acerihabitans sp. KWT182]|uniref:MurR/RpiR family transcriptional regulator n=1 Tax=Acerihabitans sp. KWT182 TaxID=3157919 RepID=A0AAU7Q674_9GAMM
MKYDPRAIGAQIRMRLPQLTPLEIKVVESITSKENLSESTPLKDIAIENNVSEAMIVKLAKKLNFTGFRDFRTSLVHYNHSEVANLHKEISPNDSSEELLVKVFKTSIQAIEETKTIIDIKAFERAAEIIYRARNIDLYGVGGSAQIARDMSHKLLKIGIRGMVHDDSHMMMMSASVLKDDDVVIAISHSGRTKAVIEAVRLASGNGAKVITISNYVDSPIVKYADVELHSTSQGSPLLGENAASRIAQLNILDALFVAIAKKDLKLAQENLNKTQMAVRSMREE